MTVIYNYKINDLIGKGTSSFVYSSTDILKNTEYAIKITKITKINNQIIDKLKSEIDILKEIDHIHIIKFYNSFIYNSMIYIVLEKCKVDLDQYIKGNIILNDQKIVWMHELMEGLIYLHSKQIIHCDLKPKNILITKMNKIKISDFGFAKLVNSPVNNKLCGTPLYMSPELLNNLHIYNYKTDYWSMGIILYYMLTGLLPYGVKNMIELKLKIKNITDIKIPLSIANNYDTNTINLIESLLIASVKYRINYIQLINHPFNHLFNPKKILTINTNEINDHINDIIELNTNELIPPYNKSYDNYSDFDSEEQIKDISQIKDIDRYSQYDDDINSSDNNEIILSSRLCYSYPLNDNCYLTDKIIFDKK